ncbi:hypothetical protein TNCV_2134001 [Trichonephila clavipes]|nr:hypothetical protein TNCV_2134001 [Trichonephila clavipes]
MIEGSAILLQQSGHQEHLTSIFMISGLGVTLNMLFSRAPLQLSDRHPIHLQWVPSHVSLLGNEVADDLAKAAISNPVDLEDHMVLTSIEIYSRAK